MMKQWNSKGGKLINNWPQQWTKVFKVIFFFIWSSADFLSGHIRNTREWKEEIIIATFEKIWAKLRASGFHRNTSKGKNSERSCYRNYGCCNVRNSSHFLKKWNIFKGENVNKIIHFTVFKQILEFTICLQAMLIIFYLLSLSLAFNEGKGHVLCDILRKNRKTMM